MMRHNLRCFLYELAQRRTQSFGRIGLIHAAAEDGDSEAAGDAAMPDGDAELRSCANLGRPLLEADIERSEAGREAH